MKCIFLPPAAAFFNAPYRIIDSSNRLTCSPHNLINLLLTYGMARFYMTPSFRNIKMTVLFLWIIFCAYYLNGVHINLFICIFTHYYFYLFIYFFCCDYNFLQSQNEWKLIIPYKSSPRCSAINTCSDTLPKSLRSVQISPTLCYSPPYCLTITLGSS